MLDWFILKGNEFYNWLKLIEFKTDCNSENQFTLIFCGGVGMQYIKPIMPKYLLLQNKNGQTQANIFTESYKNLAENGRIWLSRTSEACMVVAGRFVMATYITSTTVLGGVKLENNTPYLETQGAIPSFRRFILLLLLLFTNSSDHVPCNFHIWVQRKRFWVQLQKSLTFVVIDWDYKQWTLT